MTEDGEESRNNSTRIYPDYESLEAELHQFLTGYDKSEAYFRRNKIYQRLKESGDMNKADIIAQRLCIERKNQDNLLFPFSEYAELLDLIFSAR